MTRRFDNRRIAQFLVWHWVVGLLIIWNVLLFSESWTNWNLLSLSCQAILLVCGYPGIRRFETIAAHWVSLFFRRLEK
jgi:hypothetical protein